MFKKIIFAIKLKRAKRKADRLSKKVKQRLYVICLNGKLHVTSREILVTLIRMKKFKKGVTIDMLLKHALYKTSNPNTPCSSKTKTTK